MPASAMLTKRARLSRKAADCHYPGLGLWRASRGGPFIVVAGESLRFSPATRADVGGPAVPLEP